MLMSAVRIVMLGCLLAIPVVTAWAAPPEQGPRPHFVDLYGDPLPNGAVARFGTTEFRHTSSVCAAAISPDGQVIASAPNTERAVHLWDAPTGRRLRVIKTDSLLPPSLALTRTGKSLAIGTAASVSLWEVSTGKLIARFVDKEYMSKCSVAFSPDGKSLAVGTGVYKSPQGDKRKEVSAVLLLDATTGQPTQRLGELPGWVRDVAFTPDGTNVACAAPDAVHLWDVKTGKELSQIGPSVVSLTRIAFSPDGQAVASGDWNGRVTVWNRNTGAEVWRASAKRHPVESLAFSPDGSKLLSGAEYSTVRMNDAKTGKEVPQPELIELATVAWMGAFAADGKTVVLWGGGDTVDLWRPGLGMNQGFRAGHRTSVQGLAVSPDGRTIASAGYDGIRLWDGVTSRELRAFGDGKTSWTVAYSPDGATLAAEGDWGHVKVWQRATGRELKDLDTDEGHVVGVVFAPNGKTLYSAGVSQVQEWDLPTGKCLRTFVKLPAETDEPRRPTSFSNLVVSRDGKSLAVSDSGQLRIWDIASGKESKPLDNVGAIAFSPDGNTVACACGDDTICLWDIANQKSHDLVKSASRLGCSSLAFAPDGRSLVAGCGVEVRVWSIPKGEEVATFRGHKSRVYGVAYLPDAKTVVSASGDTTLLLWRVAGLEKQ